MSNLTTTNTKFDDLPVFHLTILHEGYAHPVFENVETANSKMKANASCVLLRRESTVAVIDPLGPWDRDFLIAALEKQGLSPDDVTYCICTHGHTDHIGNLNLFTKTKKCIVGQCVSHENVYESTCLSELGFSEFQLDGLVVVPTPGHTSQSVSVIVNAFEHGVTGIVGDLFETEKDVFSPEEWLSAGSWDPVEQRRSRAYIASVVKTIVPGHGKIFSLTTEEVDELERQSKEDTSVGKSV